MDGKGIADGMAAAFVAGCAVSAVVGWALIEGLIWAFTHVKFIWI